MIKRIAFMTVLFVGLVGLAGCETDLSNLVDGLDTDPIDLDSDTDTSQGEETDTDTDEIDDTDSDTTHLEDTDAETDTDTEAAPYLTIVTEWVDPEAAGWTELGYDASALDTYHVYVQLDGPGIDLFVVGDAGDASSSLSVVLDEGTFFNSEYGSNHTPLYELADYFPDILWDTFVTIGAETSSVGSAPGLSGQVAGLADDFSVEDSGWYVMGFPATAASDADGRVLIAQFTVDKGANISGYNWGITCVDDGSNMHEIADWTTAPTL